MKERAGEASPSWLRSLTGWPAAGMILAVFALLAITSATRKSTTFDEVAHLTAGYTYWAYNDYRLHPENGVLPQRLVALPAVLGPHDFPPLNQRAWQDSAVYEMGHQFLFTQGNDVDGMVLQGRLLMILVGVLLGGLVYGLGRHLYGPVGGTVSLVAYAFSPHILAHARLMTSDLMTALFFLLAVWAIWALLHRMTVGRLLGSALAVTGLLLSKMSGVLILPMGLALLLIRLGRREAWPVRLPGWSRDVVRRPARLGVAAAVVVVHIAVAWVLLWTFYGFHYSTFHTQRTAADRFEAGVPNLLEGQGVLGATVQFAQEQRLLPEAYLYGFSFTVDQSQRRPAFLAGERSEEGWPWFFPYAFAVKTSEALFLLLLLAAWVAVHSARDGSDWREALYRTAPLWVLLAVYAWFAVRSHLNIGHRHLLPLYPVLFLLAGASARWLRPPWTRRALAPAVVLLLVLLTGIGAWPDYLAYFNRLSGGPANGYRHLVDSSLDWGQDLPALQDWLEREAPREEPVYLSYFGTSSPDHHGIRALRLPGYFDLGRRRALVPLRGGIYCISASMLQLYGAPGSAPWGPREEQAYRSHLDRLGNSARPALRPMPYSDAAMAQFDRLRLARLCTHLRNRPPDHSVGGSILVYHLSDAEVENALYGSFTSVNAGVGTQ
jgi:hypothetical protein